MKVGLQIPAFTDDGAGVREFIVAAEELGYDSVWTGDHFVLPAKTRSEYPYAWRFSDDLPELFPDKRFLEAVSLCAFAGGVTKRVEIGVGVFVLPMRNPVAFAKELSTIDVLTGGRMIAGIGAGWLKEEFDALGMPFEERGARTDESIRLLRALWSPDQPVDFEGRFFSFKDVHCEPVPVRPGGPPIWVGGHTKPALKRCARLGVGWHAIETTPEEFVEHNKRLDDLLREEGRDPNEVERTVSTRLRLSGRLEEAAALIAAYRDGGCSHLIVNATAGRTVSENMERGRRLQEEVLRHLKLDPTDYGGVP